MNDDHPKPLGLREVIILGCGPTQVDCEYHCETWGVNGCFTFAKRLDKLFMTDEVSEVDASSYDFYLLEKSNPTLVIPTLYPKFKELTIPIEIYPIEKVLEKFPTRFFSNTIAYMIAYALLYTTSVKGPNDLRPRVIDGYHKIFLYGIDMMTNSTYIQEKGGVEYWLGIALGMGVEVINTRGSATGKTWNGRMYGYWGAKEEEAMKEGLYAPFELVRISKASQPQDEWVLVGDEYKLVKTQAKAGEERVSEEEWAAARKITKQKEANATN